MENYNGMIKADFPSADSFYKDEDDKELESISIYSGINRGIFRKGVALTSEALREKSKGKDPYDTVWNLGGIADIIAYTSAGVGALAMVAGAATYLTSFKKSVQFFASLQRGKVVNIKGNIVKLIRTSYKYNTKYMIALEAHVADAYSVETSKAQKLLNANKAGKWLMGIGAAIMVAAAILKAVQMSQ
ncbi:hypothetical protein [Lachnoclostridium sp. MSJ-17]|uniref:hypothetical protein n=1 Tax=Lachnoclostridium sp. MSJ-17 TaxID=2841516 RepID=UPI001C0F4E4C|nr:hypothetical protein [Lachnoclostridium sp. MSJ-17]MBU5462319.1 hypothetical protein [Lachnoclostridium sp. MSJ-17]